MSQTQTQSPTDKLRADYVKQLGDVNNNLGQLEQQKQGLIAYREQLKGAIFALDQLASLSSNASAPTAGADASASTGDQQAASTGDSSAAATSGDQQAAAN